jgi:hypothetical protein
MKKALAVLLALGLILPVAALAEDSLKEFVVYTDKNAKDNHYIPSGWMGDTGDIKMNDQSAVNPKTGTTSIEFVYNAKKSQGLGWAGVYWQNPANNWGNKNGGFDLSGMTKLTFWARGAKGSEVIQKVMVGGINKGIYPDSSNSEMGPIELTDTWKQYTINLAGKAMTYISGGFGWVTTADLNPDGATFYIDDIKFEADTAIKPESKKQEEMPFYIYTDSRSSKNHYVPSGWMPGQGTEKDIRFSATSKEDPYLGDTCIKIQYKDVSGNLWAGIFWLHPSSPVNNWAKYPESGYDLSRATKLTFWARGEKGSERIETFKVGGVMGENSDSDSAEIGPVILNKEWTQYTVDLKGKDMSYVNGGFCWSTNVDNNPEGATFYLDEIKFE